MKENGVVTDRDLVRMDTGLVKKKSFWEVCRSGMVRLSLLAGGSLFAGAGFMRGILEVKTDTSFLWMALMFMGVVAVCHGLKPEGR